MARGVAAAGDEGVVAAARPPATAVPPARRLRRAFISLRAASSAPLVCLWCASLGSSVADRLSRLQHALCQAMFGKGGESLERTVARQVYPDSSALALCESAPFHPAHFDSASRARRR